MREINSYLKQKIKIKKKVKNEIFIKIKKIDQQVKNRS